MERQAGSAADQRPYRANVGIALFNPSGRVLIGRRIRSDGPEIILPGLEWQMPQGGVDPGEDIEAAARRELWEETGVVSATIVARLPDRLLYDFPPYDGPAHRLSVFRGQEQTWFAMRFDGTDDEIDFAAGTGASEPEFDDWRWEDLARIPSLVVPFRRPIYGAVAAAFQRFTEPGVLER